MNLWFPLALVCSGISLIFSSPCVAAPIFSQQELEILKQQWTLPTPAIQARHQDLVRLGKKLFFDTNLSIDGSTSCASCHKPDQAWTDGLATAKGLNNKTLKRATPSIINVAYSRSFMWDGRAESLEQQALMPFFDPDEMGLDNELLLKKVNSDPSYRPLLRAAHEEDLANLEIIGKAIAEFERSIISRNTRFDRWLQGDRSALAANEQLGFKLFLNPIKSGCVICHNPPNFSDDGFHNIGLASKNKQNMDVGRFRYTPLSIMKGAFKTPSLRGIPLTPPYFHNGSASSLEDVVDHYQNAKSIKNEVSPSMTAIELSREDQSNLIAFLKSLK